MPPSLLRARDAAPLRLRLRFRAASAATICAMLGAMRGLAPRIPKIGCLTALKVNDFGQMEPQCLGRRRVARKKTRPKNLFSPRVLCINGL